MSAHTWVHKCTCAYMHMSVHTHAHSQLTEWMRPFILRLMPLNDNKEVGERPRDGGFHIRHVR